MKIKFTAAAAEYFEDITADYTAAERIEYGFEELSAAPVEARAYEVTAAGIAELQSWSAAYAELVTGNARSGIKSFYSSTVKLIGARYSM